MALAGSCAVFPGWGPGPSSRRRDFCASAKGDNPLDATAVHAESYPLVQKMDRDLGVGVRELMQKDGLTKKIDPKRYIIEGAATVQDTLEELSWPGRDPKEELEPSFAPGIKKMEDLKVAMKLPGIVTNVTAFGAFVDIGMHQDGLVHISQLRDGFVKNPTDVVKSQSRCWMWIWPGRGYRCR